MNKLILLLLFLPLISAITIYSGDTITLELDKPYAYYSIAGNSTPITLEIEQEGNFVTITPDKYTQDDSFELIFFNTEKEVITVYSGGGGSSTKYVDRNVTKYLDREVEKIVETEVEVEKEVTKNTKWTIVFIITTALLSLGMLKIYFSHREKDTMAERRYNERNE